MTTHAKTMPALSRFTPAVAAWFTQEFNEPTPIQAQAWESIRTGANTLVIAPTGSGKTFAAFLSAIDRLAAEKATPAKDGQEGAPPLQKGVRILYVSPLKALGADIERNLRAPLAAIAARQTSKEASSVSRITVGVRTGDTPQPERTRLVRNPPDILITTPESLYLMLTSKARETLATVQTVIADELHSLAGTKRGTHFSLSLERLDSLLPTPAQRIGLSATIKPVETAAQFLGGSHPVNVVQDESPPAFSLRVIVPVEDMTRIQPFTGNPGYGGMHASKPGPANSAKDAWKTDASLRRHLRTANATSTATEAASTTETASTSPEDAERHRTSSAPPDTRMGSASIWPYIESSILQQVLAHRSTIVFVNSRGICERLTAHLNEAFDRLQGRTTASSTGSNVPTNSEPTTTPHAAMRSDIGSTTMLVAESEEPLAKAHHGSVAKDRRQEIERDLKAGRLKCVVATSSLELGIDMGEVDLVIQVAAPLSVSSGLQRIGRANHQVDGKSLGILYPRTRYEVLDTAFAVEGMLAQDIEETTLVEDALDVLAQQTAAEVAMHEDGMRPEDWFATVRRSACYSSLPEAAARSVLDMLAGSFATGEGSDTPPRIDWDREADLLKPLPRTKKLAIGAAGTIPDRGLYPVMLNTGTRQKGRARVGELDEEMVHESRIGDVIILGTSTWRITEITNDRVLVVPAPNRTARLPFWHGEGTGQSLDAGLRRGKLQARLEEATAKDGTMAPTFADHLAASGFDEWGIANLGQLIASQRACTHAIPTDTRIIMETCPDETGAWYLVIHSPFGKRVHEPWALAITHRVEETFGWNPQCAAADTGIIMRIPTEEEHVLSPETLSFSPEEASTIIAEACTRTSLFAARFRECAARALLMSPSSHGKRTPLWQQRLRGGQLLEAARGKPGFPIYMEALRECLNDVYDLEGLCWLMGQIESGQVVIETAQTDTPSPFASPLLFGYVADHLYDNDMPHAERSRALLSVDPTLLSELLGIPDQLALLEPAALAAVQLEVQHLAPDRRLAGVEGVAELLRQMGPLTAEEIAARLMVPESESSTTQDTATQSTVTSLLKQLVSQHRACFLSVAKRRLWATPEDALRLRALTSTSAVPDWVLSWEQAAQLDDPRLGPGAVLASKALQTHALISASSLAAQLGTGPSVVEGALAQLQRTGSAVSLDVSAAAHAILEDANRNLQAVEGDRQGAPSPTENAPLLPTEGSVWTSQAMLRRLRLRSRDLVEQKVRPVPGSSLSALVIEQQRIGGTDGLTPMQNLAECIALFEGTPFPATLWEESVFPARVPSYQPSLLDELLDSEEVLWLAVPQGSKEPTIALFPTDSPFAPQVLDASTESVAQTSDADAAPPPPVTTPLQHEILDLLCHQGASTLSTLVRLLQETTGARAISPSQVAHALQTLAEEGAVTSTSFACVRRGRPASPAPSPPAQRRVSSRRSSRRRDALSSQKRERRAQMLSGQQELEALAGRWSVLCAPEAAQTEQAMAQTDAILDAYGVLCPQTIQASGFKGGVQALYTVLRSMEDAGEVMRGEFVEGLGASQFARRHTVEALRTTSPSQRIVVLDAQDPAMLYGTVLPWPEPAASLVPTHKTGCQVVLKDGAPIMFATKHLQHLITFTQDEADWREAATALMRYREHPPLACKSRLAKEKTIVEKLNGKDIYGTAMQEILADLGFMKDTHGMRLIVNPF